MAEHPEEFALHEGWAAWIEGLRKAEATLLADSGELSKVELADAYQSLLRACLNQLGRFEVDRASPELTPYNGWREKFFMDNPDFLYWVADISADHEYLVEGNLGDARFWSITAYTASGLADARASARIDLDSLVTDKAGNFEITVSRTSGDAQNCLQLPEQANSIWVRGFYDDVYNDRPGFVTIKPLNGVKHPATPDAKRLAHRLQRLGRSMSGAAKGMVVSAEADLTKPNQVRVWEEMQAGAVFTEPEIHYQRGAWQLGPDEALVIDVSPVACRYWNLMLYSRFLNSLDHRNRPVSLTGGRAKSDTEGQVRIILSAQPDLIKQADPSVNSLDTEGRPFGIFVLRWLKPNRTPELPSLKVVAIDELIKRRGNE